MTIKVFRVLTEGKNIEKLSDELVNTFGDIDISWLSDGSAVISCDAAQGKIDEEMEKHGLKSLPSRKDIKHRVRVKEL